jgi:site-specific DNA-methyltransferase (adenine-specific)
MIQLIQGDCITEMQKIQSGSVDAIITDPPYGTTACKWDSVIPFEPMWEQLNRIIKPNGAIVLFGSEPFSSALRMSNIKNYKYDWIFKKSRPSGFVHAKNKPMKHHEIISIFSEGATTHATQSTRRMPYNPQGLVSGNFIRKQSAKSRASDSGMSYRPSHKDSHVAKFTNYPTSILEFKSETGYHPTQKPLLLMEYLIKTYTNENELVLDFTMGSGSTGVAAKNLNRSFIGIEQDPKYFKIAEERINKPDLFS